jgi:hypothetical protein
MMDIFLIAAEAGGEEAAAASAADFATAALTAGELSGVGAGASGLTAIPAGLTQAEAAAMAQSAAAGGPGAGAGINALQQGAVTSPVTAPNIINSSVNPVTGVPGSFNPSFDPTSLGAPPPPPMPAAPPVAPSVAPPPFAPAGINTAPPFAGPAPTAGLAQYGPYPELKVGQGGGGFLNNLFGGPPASGVEGYTAKTPGGMYTLPGEGGAEPKSAFMNGLDKAMSWADAHPKTTMAGAYLGASALGLLNPNRGNFNSAPYSGPLSKYKLSPNYQATIANPSQYQYAPRYAEGGIMQMAQGGVTGSGNLTLNVPVDFGGDQNSTQSTPNYAFGNENSGANTGFFGQNSTQVNAPVNPQGSTNSFMTQQAGTPDLMQSFQQLKPEAKSAPINVGGPADVSQNQNQPQKFAGGGSTGNLSSTLDYYTKMMEGETPKMPSSHPTDAGIYHDTDPDTRSLDPYSAARVRQAKTNKRAYVSLPSFPAPTPMGQLNLSPPGAKSDATQYQEAAKGGIMGVSDLGGYAAGGNPRLLKGPGDGMSDNIPATINGRQPARLADGEFVIPADVVSHLGNGSTEAGAKVLHQMMTKVRQERTGNPKQGKQINPHKYIPR